MKEEKIKLTSEVDKLELDCIMIIPEGEIKGIVQLVHGMNEHKERYIEFMKYLAEKNYASIIHDHRGHGKSIRKDEDLGYFYDDKAEAVVEDVYQITKYLKERFKDKKIILFGHSMGSMIVRKFIAKYDDEIDKLIVCGSPSQNKGAKAGLAIIKIMKTVKGEKYHSKSLKKIMFKGYDKKGQVQNSWICNNKDIVEKYNKDKLCQYEYTLNGYENIVRLMIDIYNEKIYQKKNLKLPIYFIAGREDPVIISEKDWYRAQDFLKNIGYENISSKLYDNMKHEILNEENNKIVYEDILKFL